MSEWFKARGHAVAILWSRRSRDASANEAVEAGATYTFVDAWGQSKTWLKGEYAYLAANAASLFLSRCNLKYDIVEEAQLNDEAALAGYQLLLVPNAGHLSDETIARIGRWREGDARRLLFVTGKTNLPPAWLGLVSLQTITPAGYTGWCWRVASAFAGPNWQRAYASGYAGHRIQRAEARADARVLADLVEFGGDISNAETATITPQGAGIVTTPQSIFVANQVFELIGGMLQAHLNVEAIRHWANPTHWGDTLLFFLRHVLRDATGDRPFWTTRLRSFGAYDGVLSFRHDVHGMADHSMLNYQIENLVPASYDIEDPGFSTNINESMAVDWVRRVTRNSFIEPALHNDSTIGDPPTAVQGKGLFAHVVAAEKSLGFTVCTCGRHGGGHMHPETIDAMDYLYAHHEAVIGMCTFCYYHMIEYGVATPGAFRAGPGGAFPVTYITDMHRTIATQGVWFPFHAVVTALDDWRPLRGWDRTHEFDSSYELVETVFAGRHSRNSTDPSERLENGVYSFQYHPELARDPGLNDGKGTLDWLRYCINLAERHNFWIATQKELYQRMADYEDLAFRISDDGLQVRIVNPGPRRIVGMVIEQRLPFASVWHGDEEIGHVAGDRFVTVPPIAPGAEIVLSFSDKAGEAPIVRQPSNKGLTIVDARNEPGGDTRLTVSVCRNQPLGVEGVDPDGVYLVEIDGQPPMCHAPRIAKTIEAMLANRQFAASAAGSFRERVEGVKVFLDLVVQGKPDNFREVSMRIRKLAPELAARARSNMLAAAASTRSGRINPGLPPVDWASLRLT